MRSRNQLPDPEIYEDQLARLAEMLRLDVSAEDLTALSHQLRLIDALEQSALHDIPPILKMDADWHE